MKRVAIWFVAALLVNGGGAAWLSQYSTEFAGRVLIVLDSSFSMQAVWGMAPEALEALAERHPASTFDLLYTQGQQQAVNLALPLGIKPFGNRSVAERLPELLADPVWPAHDLCYLISTEQDATVPCRQITLQAPTAQAHGKIIFH